MTTSTPQHTLTLPWVTAATRNFVFIDKMREAISLALASGLNLVLYGPGGHGKSEVLQAVFDAINGVEPFVQSLHQGTTVDDLYGGIDMASLNEVIRYNTDNSFLGHRAVFFEEGLSAPPRAIASLRDTLTAGALRNGTQRVPLTTSFIAIPTNHDPRMLADGDPALLAFLERFPITLMVQWRSYDADAFTQMFEADGANDETPRVTWDDIETLRKQTENVQVDDAARAMLGYILAGVHADLFISPRMAKLALRLVKAAAAINGRDYIVTKDFEAMLFLSGFNTVEVLTRELILDAKSTFEATAQLVKLEQQFSELQSRAEGVTDVNQLNGLIEQLITLNGDAVELQSPPGANKRFVALRNGIATLRTGLQTRISEQESMAATANAFNRLDEVEKLIRQLRNSVQRATSKSDLAPVQSLIGQLVDEMRRLKVEPYLQPHLDDIRTALGNLLTQATTKRKSMNGGWSPK
jgi:MoxR-like ATPase